MPINDISCTLPFEQAVVRTDGKISPCCIIIGTQNIKNTSLGEYWKNARSINIRNQIAEGTTPLDVGCQYCYKDDASGLPSMRANSLANINKQQYDIMVDNRDQSSYPKRLEFHVSNICNLKCLTCRPEDSSLFLTEDRILKISDHNQMDYQIDENLIADTIEDALNNKIEYIDLRGGETLMVPVIKKMLARIPTEVCKQVDIRFQTNATLIDNEWIDIFNKFRNTYIHLSIDGYGEKNNYIRFPSKWDQIDRNVDNLIKNKKISVTTYVLCTVSNLNLLCLHELIKWTRSKMIPFYWSRLYNPPHYSPSNMPIDLFNLAKEQLSTFKEFNGLTNIEHNDSEWQNFCDMITIRDTHRKNSIFDCVPEFRQYWTK